MTTDCSLGTSRYIALGRTPWKTPFPIVPYYLGVFTDPLPSNRRPIVARVVSRGIVFAESVGLYVTVRLPEDYRWILTARDQLPWKYYDQQLTVVNPFSAICWLQFFGIDYSTVTLCSLITALGFFSNFLNWRTLVSISTYKGFDIKEPHFDDVTWWHDISVTPWFRASLIAANLLVWLLLRCKTNAVFYSLAGLPTEI
jgi:hypothetical protein